jgi:hypothetical protein
MPGPIHTMQCPCGYSGWLKPGASEQTGLRVIAYDDQTPQLITVAESDAKARQLEIIPDPYVADAPIPDAYRCPVCGNNALEIFHTGFWD